MNLSAQSFDFGVPADSVLSTIDVEVWYDVVGHCGLVCVCYCYSVVFIVLLYVTKSFI